MYTGRAIWEVSADEKSAILNMTGIKSISVDFYDVNDNLSIVGCEYSTDMAAVKFFLLGYRSQVTAQQPKDDVSGANEATADQR